MNMNMITSTTGTNSIDNGGAKPQRRLSNIELLRITAMVMVMLYHVFPGTIGFSYERIHDYPVDSVIGFGIESLSVVCVDVFVFISGWFGIRVNTRKLLELCFQTLFFAVLVYAVLLAIAPEKYLHWDAASTLLCLHADDYWFVKAYIGLMIFAPVLNAFLEHTTEKSLRWVLIAFYCFQTLYGWLSINGVSWIAGGYSCFSFIGFYLLAHYVRHFMPVIQHTNKYVWLALYLLIAFGQMLLASLLTWWNIPVAGRLFTYTNPLVILQTVALFLFFRQLKFESNLINHIAKGSLAVYLLHVHPLVLHDYYGRWVFDLYQSEHRLTFTAAFVTLMIGIFALAVLLDGIRRRLSSLLIGRFAPKT